MAKVVNCAVVIPYFNGEETIERAVVSALNQTVKPSEILVVDDGSKDESARVLQDLAKKHQFRVVTTTNGGQGAARNAGVAAVSTEYIAFLDQDDYFLPEHFEVLCDQEILNNARFGFVYGDLFEGNFAGNIIDETVVRFPVLGIGTTNLHSILGKDLFVLPSASVISRSAFLAVGGFDAQFRGYEDDDLFLRLFQAGFTHTFINRPVAVWCMHQGNTSYSMTMSRSRWAYFKKLTNVYPDEPAKLRFYFKNCLVPRFENMFINDLVKSHAASEDDFNELLEIFRDYMRIVIANSTIPNLHKISLRLKYWVLAQNSPKVTGLAMRSYRSLLILKSRLSVR